MSFHKNRLYHIYNQGNNHRQVFLSDENYIFFLWKMRGHLLPFGDLVAYALMPNHFHWLFFVKEPEILREGYRIHLDNIEFQRRKAKYGDRAIAAEYEGNRTSKKEDLVTLNEAIGKLQSSYTRAFNKENNFIGSLFSILLDMD